MEINNKTIDFTNSEIAFKNKTNSQLREAYLLFKVMNNPLMVKIGKNLVRFAFSIHFPIDGGQTLTDCSKTVE